MVSTRSQTKKAATAAGPIAASSGSATQAPATPTATPVAAPATLKLARPTARKKITPEPIPEPVEDPSPSPPETPPSSSSDSNTPPVSGSDTETELDSDDADSDTDSIVRAPSVTVPRRQRSTESMRKARRSSLKGPSELKDRTRGKRRERKSAKFEVDPIATQIEYDVGAPPVYTGGGLDAGLTRRVSELGLNSDEEDAEVEMELNGTKAMTPLSGKAAARRV